MQDLEIEKERERRAQDCMDSLNAMIGIPTSEHMRKRYEEKRDMFQKDYGIAYSAFLRRGIERG